MVRRRPRDERGAAAIEAALVTLPLFMILMGIVEMSFLMKDVAAVNSSVAAGARTAAVSAAAGKCGTDTVCGSANDPRLGRVTADALKRAGVAVANQDIEWLMVYEADAAGLPLGQTAGSSDPYVCRSNCVVYRPDATGRLVRSGSVGWDTTSTVNACVNDANRDAVGVAMRVKHRWLSGFVSSTLFDYTERNVVQFEPLPNEACLPGRHA